MLRRDFADTGITVFVRLVQPGERKVGFAAKGIDSGDVVGSLLCVLGDQRGECGIRVGLASQRVVRNRASRSFSRSIDRLGSEFPPGGHRIPVLHKRGNQVERARRLYYGRDLAWYGTTRSPHQAGRRRPGSGSELNKALGFTGSRRHATLSTCINASSARPRIRSSTALNRSTSTSVGSSASAATQVLRHFRQGRSRPSRRSQAEREPVRNSDRSPMLSQQLCGRQRNLHVYRQQPQFRLA